MAKEIKQVTLRASMAHIDALLYDLIVSLQIKGTHFWRASNGEWLSFLPGETSKTVITLRVMMPQGQERDGRGCHAAVIASERPNGQVQLRFVDGFDLSNKYNALPIGDAFIELANYLISMLTANADKDNDTKLDSEYHNVQVDGLKRNLIAQTKNLNKLRDQAAIFGINVPLNLQNEIEKTEEVIAEIKEQLAALGQDS